MPGLVNLSHELNCNAGTCSNCGSGKLFNINHRILLVLAVILVAGILRLAWLGSVPAGFHNDEASFFINALAIKANGMDEDGRFLPLHLRSYIDPKPALYSYLQAPLFEVLGESWSVARLPVAFLALSRLA